MAIYNSEEDRAAKSAAIYGLLAPYHQLTEKLTRAFLGAFVDAVDDCRVEAVAQACKRIAQGRAPGVNSNFPPTPADVAISARLFEELAAARENEIPLYTGIINADFGHGLVDMRGLTEAEQDKIYRLHGMSPDGRNLAFMPLEAKREALKAPAISGSAPRPQLQKMRDA